MDRRIRVDPALEKRLPQHLQESHKGRIGTLPSISQGHRYYYQRSQTRNSSAVEYPEPSRPPTVPKLPHTARRSTLPDKGSKSSHHSLSEQQFIPENQSSRAAVSPTNHIVLFASLRLNRSVSNSSSLPLRPTIPLLVINLVEGVHIVS